VEEIRKKEDLWGLEFEEILGFRSEILRFEVRLEDLRGIEGGFLVVLAHIL
jgi:hypothetical protein